MIVINGCRSQVPTIDGCRSQVTPVKKVGLDTTLDGKDSIYKHLLPSRLQT
jgi:hypothetical protein